MVNEILEAASCISCGQIIKDPICKDCYLRQTGVLLKDLELHYIPKEFINDKMKGLLNHDSLYETKCVLCKKEIVTVCHKCYLEFLIKILREINFTEKLIENLEDCQISEEFYYK